MIAGSPTCPACGEEVGPGDRFCEACGGALGDERPADGRVELHVAGAAGVTHRGLRHRRNEDAMHVALLADATVAVVCDGVSTSSQPHVASRAGADTAGAVLAGPGDLVTRVERAVAAAQAAVARVPRNGVTRASPPACTFVGAAWDGERIVVTNVGDSRAYWIGADEARSLTEDDSVARELERLGYPPDEIARSGASHAIVRWLGADAPAEPFRATVYTPVAPGHLVLCSDGLWNYADAPDALAAQVRAAGATDAAALAHALVDHALASGGEDNVTVVVVECIPVSPAVGVAPGTPVPPEELT